MRKPNLRGRGPHYPVLDRIVQYDFEPGYTVFTMPAPKRLRVMAGGATAADTTAGLLLYESDHLPVYYFPLKDVDQALLQPSATRTQCPYKGTASYYSLKIGGTQVADAAWRYAEPIAACPDIADYLAFYWDKMEHWYEEDEEVFVHPRDPFRRIDCLPSSRRVQVVVDGETVADSRRGIFLFEAGLPTRYYLPIADTRLDLLTPSPLQTRCPYKGTAAYYHLTVKGTRHDNLVWYYPEPLPESARIKGLVCFYNEFVDRILVDGIEQPRPASAG
jgi:uncharacterized protein (DUF427 family)